VQTNVGHSCIACLGRSTTNSGVFRSSHRLSRADVDSSRARSHQFFWRANFVELGFETCVARGAKTRARCEMRAPRDGTVLGARCSVLSAQCSVLSAQCSVLSAQCSVLSAQCSVLSAQCSVLSAQCSVLSATCRATCLPMHSAPRTSTKHSRSTEHSAPSTQHLKGRPSRGSATGVSVYQLMRDTSWMTRAVFVPVKPVTR
jgi:hypothetical protein